MFLCETVSINKNNIMDLVDLMIEKAEHARSVFVVLFQLLIPFIE